MVISVCCDKDNKYRTCGFSLKSVVLNLFCRLCDVHLFISTHEREARNTHSVMRMVVCNLFQLGKIVQLAESKGVTVQKRI